MQLGEISFCDKIGYNIRSDDIKKKILRELECDYVFKVIQRHYDKYTSSVHDNILKSNPHLVCTRTNGNPYLLYLTRINFVNQCIFIDKKIQQGYNYPRMIVAKFMFADELFKNTLFEGEMIKDNRGKWTFLIGDLIADSGCMLQNQNLTKRLNRIYNILQTQYKEDSINICNIKVKKYFYYNQIPYLLNEYQQTLNYKIRGLYFKPLFLKFRDILFNFDDSLIVQVKRVKFKEHGAFLTSDAVQEPQTQTKCVAKEENTIIDCSKEHEFWIMRTDNVDIYDVIDLSSNKKIGIACINKLETSKLMQKLFQHSTPMTKIKMSCKFHEKFQKWVPLRQVA